MIISEDGVLYTALDDTTVRVWRPNFCSHDQPHSLTVILHAKHSSVKALTLTNDGTILYGVCSDGYIHYWLKGWFVGQMQYSIAKYAKLCLASIAKYVVSGSSDSSNMVWFREEDGEHVCLAVLVGHRGPIRCVTGFLGTCFVDVDDHNENNDSEDCVNVCMRDFYEH